MKVVYTTRATAHGGRDGCVRTEDGRLAVGLKRPAEMGGAEGEGTDPEQLLACAHAAGFLEALKVAAIAAAVVLPLEAAVSATVGLGRRSSEDGHSLAVALTVHVPGVPRRVAEALIRQAEAACPYCDLARGGGVVRVGLG